MQAGWQSEFPTLHRLYASSDTSDCENYFANLDAPRSELATKSYQAWNNRLAQLDAKSLENIVERAAPYVCKRDRKNERHYSALFEVLNEVKGYGYLLELGCEQVRFVPRTSNETPDLEGRIGSQTIFLEVKTVNRSCDGIAAMGTVQRGVPEIPEGLRNKLCEDYSKACSQLNSMPSSKIARKICLFYIHLDLPVVLYKENQKRLDDFLMSVEKPGFEIQHESGVW